MDIELRCNQQPCRKPVTDKAVVVSSSVLSLYTESNHPVFRPHVRTRHNNGQMPVYLYFFARVGSHIFCSMFSEGKSVEGTDSVAFKSIVQTRHSVPHGYVLVSLYDRRCVAIH